MWTCGGSTHADEQHRVDASPEIDLQRQVQISQIFLNFIVFGNSVRISALLISQLSSPLKTIRHGVERNWMWYWMTMLTSMPTCSEEFFRSDVPFYVSNAFSTILDPVSTFQRSHSSTDPRDCLPPPNWHRHYCVPILSRTSNTAYRQPL